jgi:hypothetical protein
MIIKTADSLFFSFIIYILWMIIDLAHIHNRFYINLNIFIIFFQNMYRLTEYKIFPLILKSLYIIWLHIKRTCFWLIKGKENLVIIINRFFFYHCWNVKGKKKSAFFIDWSVDLCSDGVKRDENSRENDEREKLSAV